MVSIDKSKIFSSNKITEMLGNIRGKNNDDAQAASPDFSATLDEKNEQLKQAAVTANVATLSNKVDTLTEQVKALASSITSLSVTESQPDSEAASTEAPLSDDGERYLSIMKAAEGGSVDALLLSKMMASSMTTAEAVDVVTELKATFKSPQKTKVVTDIFDESMASQFKQPLPDANNSTLASEILGTKPRQDRIKPIHINGQ